MTKVVALQTWSNGTITMDEKSVFDIDDALAADLIAKGIVADAATYFGGGGSGGGVLVVTDTEGTLNKTWQEIHDAMLSGGAVVSATNPPQVMQVIATYHDTKDDIYLVNCRNNSMIFYGTATSSGYPTIVE